MGEKIEKKKLLDPANPTSPIIIFTLSLTSSLCTAATTAAPTAYDLLKTYNFPIGLLPEGIKNYTLNPTTGKFNIHLNRTCSFSLEDSYQIRYESSISGYIEENRLTGLGGIRVKVLFFWLDIGEVDRSGDDLEFFVGVVSANFPVGNFDVCPQCGCGMDCDFVRKIKNE
ncbi:hypothetical protein DCAR_0314031 [Daucus carota subsp. sativus]|uniref:DUF538 domain-containing protein n=1 Tax=Daucus carota subsp. sativus TaxID=79200 RepID=A0AAF0WSS1_DAUCS|nr:PREDICTED: uncharacterized protein LOC108212869 [Daucus carota subsp. sativus]WOG94734.1 hypothetical protein DCAR_0314031 [Daucus carota subsp. sativus]